ncbi:MAG: hypothetical protein DCF31_15475, partial [Alphaproteobacteria bacterium]
GYVAGGTVTGGTTTAAGSIAGTGSSLVLDTTTAGSTLTLAATSGDIDSVTASAGGDTSLTAAGNIASGSLASGGTLTLVAGGSIVASDTRAIGFIDASAGTLAQFDTVVAGGAMTVAANQVTIGDADVGAFTASAGALGAAIERLRSQGDIAVTSAGGIAIGTATSSAGTLTATAAGAITAGTLASAGATTLTAAGITADSITAASLTANSTAPARLTTVATSGDITVTAAPGLDFGSMTSSAGNVLLTAGTVTGTTLVGGNVTVNGGTITLADVTARGVLATTSSLGTRLGTAGSGGDATIAAGTDLDIGSLASGGRLALTAAGNITATTLRATGPITATAAAIASDSTTAGGTLALAATNGNLVLGAVGSGGNANLTATGTAAVQRGLTVNGDLSLTAASVALAATGTATQSATGMVAITARSGAITGGNGLSLASGAGRTLTLTALGSEGSIGLGSGSSVSAGNDVAMAATGAVNVGAITATGRTVTLTGADAGIGGTIRAARIALVDSGAGPIRIGDTPTGNETEFAAVPTARFDLTSAEVARLETVALVIDGRSRNIVVGALPIAANSGSGTFSLRTLGRVDVLGRMVATGSAAGRVFTLGGDGSADSKAGVIRVATTASDGGRLLTDGAVLTLNGDRIGVGYDANLLGAIGVTPGAAAVGAADVAARFVSQANSALYTGSLGGQAPYVDTLVISARGLAVNYGQFALFQNSGPAGLNAGVVLGALGAGGNPPALSITASAAAVPNAFAVFGTINGINGAGTSLLGPDGITLVGPVSRANARANGCLIGSSGGGCLSASLAQPVLVLFDSKSEIFRVSDNLALPFDPLVGTSNEALFSDIAGIDIPANDPPAEAPPCRPGGPTPCADQDTRK